MTDRRKGNTVTVNAAAEAHPALALTAGRLAAGGGPGARGDGRRLALAIEGGGMRGTITAGMALGVHELGPTPVFDDVYGSSAGALTGAWLCSANPPGLRIWYDTTLTRALIKRASLLRPRRPVLDAETLTEQACPEVMGFGSVPASPLPRHVLATGAATGEAVDLRPHLDPAPNLRRAPRASCALPLLAGPPVALAGRRYLDSGLPESIPYKTATAQGPRTSWCSAHGAPGTWCARPGRVPPARSPPPCCAATRKNCVRRSSPAPAGWPPTTRCCATDTRRSSRPGQRRAPRRPAGWPATATCPGPPSKRAAPQPSWRSASRPITPQPQPTSQPDAPRQTPPDPAAQTGRDHIHPPPRHEVTTDAVHHPADDTAPPSPLPPMSAAASASSAACARVCG